MGAMESHITILTIVYSTFILAQTNEKSKALRHWPLSGEFTGDQWRPPQMTSDAKMFLFDDVIIGKQSWIHYDITYAYYPMRYNLTQPLRYTNA